MDALPIQVLHLVVYYAVRILLGYIGLTTVAASAVAVLQERKIWRPKSLPSLSWFGLVKVFLFNMVWMATCLLGSILITIKWIVLFGTSDIQRDGNRIVEDTAARLVIQCFVGRVQVLGQENLPSGDDDSSVIPAPVYIANHASQIDAAVVYYLNRRFKWIAKKSVLYVPGVGQIMWLSQHVLIDRKKGANAKSVSNLFEKSNVAVQAGLPMFFFPQGTRSIATRLPAKDGAFIVAMTNQSTLIPISIDIPRNVWNVWYPLNQLWGGIRPVVKITVHPPIPVADLDRERLKQKCMDQIYSVLPTCESPKTK
jgi:lysophosphatidate acyltransferase